MLKIRGKYFILIRGRKKYDNTHKKSYKAEREIRKETQRVRQKVGQLKVCALT